MRPIDPEDFNRLAHQFAGYCVNCDAITRDTGVPMGGSGCHCPRCGLSSLYGIEDALVMDLVSLQLPPWSP